MYTFNNFVCIADGCSQYFVKKDIMWVKNANKDVLCLNCGSLMVIMHQLDELREYDKDKFV